MHNRDTEPRRGRSLAMAIGAAMLAAMALVGCKSPHAWRVEADGVAADIVKANQLKAIGRNEAFSIKTPADVLRRRLLKAQELPVAGPASLGTDQLKPVPHWPGTPTSPATDKSPAPPAKISSDVRITLLQALQIAARNNREYQRAKETVFTTALNLDLESQEFRNTYVGLLSGGLSHDETGARPVGQTAGGASARWSRRFRSGAALTGRIGVDLIKLLTQNYGSSLGVVADASISVPLLRGAGRHIVTEPLTQAQRNVIYSMYALERHKRTLAVLVAADYLGVLQQTDQVKNATENLLNLTRASQRAARLGKAGRLPKTQVNQAQQDELRARQRLILARDRYQGGLDALKLTLGLPTDARILLDRNELSALVVQAAAALGESNNATANETSSEPGKLELPVLKAVELALGNRLDLRTAQGRVVDAQRGVVVAADGLKADLTLTGTAATGAARGLGTAALDNAQLRPEKGAYSATVTSSLPWERTAERNAYRTSYITLEQAARSVQALEDSIKLAVRNELRTLAATRQSFVIQSSAVDLATTRVKSTELFLEAGRAEIRDVLEAQEALVQAQDAMTAALVNYRIAELQLQRDMGVLEVDEKGLWREYRPE